MTWTATCARRWSASSRRRSGCGQHVQPVAVGMRTGDTSPEERRQLARVPPDILITTPESLYLLLTSRAREGLVDVDTVIVDEVHAVAGTKRGAHLAVSLERLEALRRSAARRRRRAAAAHRPVGDAAAARARWRGSSAEACRVPPSSMAWTTWARRASSGVPPARRASGSDRRAELVGDDPGTQGLDAAPRGRGRGPWRQGLGHRGHRPRRGHGPPRRGHRGAAGRPGSRCRAISGARSGRRCTRGSSTWSWRTARRSCSATRGAWRSGCARA